MNSFRKTVKGNLKHSPSKLALGISLTIVGIMVILGRNKPKTSLSTSFDKEPVKVEGLSSADLDEAKIPRRIIIPFLSVDLDIKKSEIVNGFWEVFDDSAAWGVGSGLPGEIGNQIIFAHAKEDLFLPLRSIKPGMKAYILTESDWHEYEVKDIKEVYPNQLEVIAPTEDENLTLYTCSGFADSRRLIVVAKPI